MAQALVDAVCIHHRVTVLCARPPYDTTERRPWRLYQTETAGRARIIRAGSTACPRFEMKKRLVNYLRYVALAIPRALFVPCDAVLAMTDPPFQGIVGAIVATLKRKPYVYNIRDLYPDMALGGSIVAPGMLARVWEKLQRWARRSGTRVIVLGEDMGERIIAKRVEPARVLVVRDGTEILPTNTPLPAPNSEVVRAIRGNFSFVLVHAGNLGFYGAWNTLVTAARHLTNEGVGLVFVGDGAQRPQIEAAAEGSGNIRFLEFFPASRIPSVLAAGDAPIITVKRGLEGVVVPSKMYGILAAGKTILAVAPKGTDAVALGVRRGFAVAADPDRPAEVVNAVRALASDPNKLKAMSEAARAAAADYDRVGELEKFVKIIDELKAN